MYIATRVKHFVQNFIWSKGGPVESIETRQGWNAQDDHHANDHGKEKQEDYTIEYIVFLSFSSATVPSGGSRGGGGGGGVLRVHEPPGPRQ